jgi:hypothetical protein
MTLLKKNTIMNGRWSIIQKSLSKKSTLLEEKAHIILFIFLNYSRKCLLNKTKMINTASEKYKVLFEKSKNLEIEFNRAYSKLNKVCALYEQNLEHITGKLEQEEQKFENSISLSIEFYSKLLNLTIEYIQSFSKETKNKNNNLLHKINRSFVDLKDVLMQLGDIFPDELELKFESLVSKCEKLQDDFDKIRSNLRDKVASFDFFFNPPRDESSVIKNDMEKEKIYTYIRAMTSKISSWINFLKKLRRKMVFAEVETHYIEEIDLFLKLIKRIKTTLDELNPDHSNPDKLYKKLKIVHKKLGIASKYMREFYFSDVIINSTKFRRVIHRKIVHLF